jgi:Tfp pilus assembly protein PilF
MTLKKRLLIGGFISKRTADLFANIKVVRERRKQVLEKKKRVQKLSKIGWRHFKRRHLELFIAVSACLLLMIGVGRIGWGKYQFHQSANKGSAYLQGLSRLNMDKAIIKDPQNLSTMLWTDDENSIQLAMNNLTNQISQNRQDYGSICLLSEGFVRKAVLSGNVHELTLARNLLDYLSVAPAKNGDQQLPKDEPCRWRAEAVYYWSQGASSKAQSFVAKYLDKKPDPYGYFIRGLLAVDQQDMQVAQRDMHEASRLMPNNTVFLSAIAKLLEKNEKWNESIALLDDALRKDPNNAGLLKRLGYCYEKSGNLYEAEKIYQRGLQFTNNPEEFQYLLVSLYNNQSQHEQVVRAAHHYLDSYPEGTHQILVQQLNNQAQQVLDARQAEEAKRDSRKSSPGSTRRRLWIRR